MRIFISYRRDDSEGEAGRLFDDLRPGIRARTRCSWMFRDRGRRDFRKAIDESVRHLRCPAGDYRRELERGEE